MSLQISWCKYATCGGAGDGEGQGGREQGETLHPARSKRYQTTNAGSARRRDKKKKGAMLFCWVHKLLQSEHVLRVALCYRLWHMLDFSSVMSCHTLAHKLTTVQETADGHMKSCMRLFGIRWLEVKLLLLLLHRHFISARHFHLCSRHRNSSNLPHDSYTVIV